MTELFPLEATTKMVEPLWSKIRWDSGRLGVDRDHGRLGSPLEPAPRWEGLNFRPNHWRAPLELTTPHTWPPVQMTAVGRHRLRGWHFRTLWVSSPYAYEQWGYLRWWSVLPEHRWREREGSPWGGKERERGEDRRGEDRLPHGGLWMGRKRKRNELWMGALIRFEIFQNWKIDSNFLNFLIWPQSKFQKFYFNPP